MTAAALGGAIEVPTIDGGKAKVNVPPGTQTGQQFRLRNKGMSVLNTRQRGDMYIEARIETPVNLSANSGSCCMSSKSRRRQVLQSGDGRVLRQGEDFWRT